MLHNLQWVKLKNGISYALLDQQEKQQLQSSLGRDLSETLPIMFIEDALIKQHNKAKPSDIISVGSVLAFLREQNQLRTGQKINYVYYRIVSEGNIPVMQQYTPLISEQ